MLKISVTGHRPLKIGGYAPCARHKAIRRHMRELLTKLKAENSDLLLYSGGALGIDQFWMEVGQHLEIPVVAILPFPGFASVWPQASQDYLKILLAKCQSTRYVHNTLIPDKQWAAQAMLDRDQELVNACDLLVAYWNGTRGGTAHTVRLANKTRKDLLTFNPDEIY